MAIVKGVAANDIIKQLLELAGKEYCSLVTGITITADINDAVMVEVRMLAEKSKEKDLNNG